MVHVKPIVASVKLAPFPIFPVVAGIENDFVLKWLIYEL